MSKEGGLFERVTEEEFQEFLKAEFSGNGAKYKVEVSIYEIIFVVFIIIALISLVLFYKKRKSYIIRQRNFYLTFIGGIFTFISVVCSFLSQLMKTTCMYNVVIAGIFNTIVNYIFLSRSLRVILYYYLNIYKVSSVKNKKIIATCNIHYIGPNSYLPKIYKRIKKIIIGVIVIPTILSIIPIFAIYILNGEVRKQCNFSGSYDTLTGLKQNRGKVFFQVIGLYTIVYTLLTIVIAFFLFRVKDVNKYGLKFECLSVSLLVIIVGIINVFLQRNASQTKLDSTEKEKKYPYKFVLLIYQYTKGGRMLFTCILIYMFLSSISLPIIHYYRAKNIKSNYIDDSIYSFQYFYKVLNTPTLVNDLREIAIKEFSAENVLFWENYQVLQLMIYRYQVEYNKAMDKGDENLVSQYNFDEYYEHQMQSLSASSIEEADRNRSYDPNMIVPKEILPYYLTFYDLFIDSNGPAVVNIDDNISKKIDKNIHSNPTIGIYDEAKNEVVQLMFDGIYDIFLKKYKKHINKTLP